MIWLPAHDPSEVDEEDIKETKYVNIGDITSLRLGTDIDPMTPNEALINAAKEKVIPQSTLMAVLELKDRDKKDLPKKTSKAAKTVKKASSLLESLFVSKDKDFEILYGTEVLRENCTPEQMKISFALFTDDRVLNIQCLEQKDYDILVKNLKIVISPPPSMDHHIAMKLGKNPMKGQVFGRKSWKERSASAPIRNKKSRSKSIGDLDYMESRDELLKKFGSSNNSIGKSNSKDDQDVNLSSSSFSTKKDETKPLVPTKAFLDFMAKIDVHSLTPILYEQNRYYGTNMYTTLKPGDEIIVENYLLRGYTMEVALNRLFAKHVLRKMNQLTPVKSENGVNSSNNPITVRNQFIFL